jgi:Putative beta-barrel porin-2, OmpL-like. bbp2
MKTIILPDAVAMAALVLVIATSARAQAPDTTTKLKVNGFVDVYYAYDFTRPYDGERRYTTQSVRHDEANVNLAWIGLTFERRRVRARVALQAGTSVQANYSGEPRTGASSGPDLARNVQEAFVGVTLADNVWIDGGIYYSYVGLESWSSSDNPTYTRSLVADYTPYYLSGARLTWQATPKLSTQFQVVNGWQNISENNRSKAVGSRVDYAVSPAFTLSYANFLGNERPTGSPSQLRVFNQVMAKGALKSGTQWQGQVDVGHQAGSDWYGLVSIVKQPVSPRVALVGRVERYSDPDQVIIATGSVPGFVGNGASLGLDVQIDASVRWRSELRGIRTSARLFPEGPSQQPTGTNAVLVTSLSASF